jgi:conjugative relaxase-like TrwC/TraI family protein
MHWNSITYANYVDYLEKETTEKVYWQGKAAERLELEGRQVTRPEFKLLTEGIDPVHGEVLRPRVRHNLTREREGKVEIYARPVRLYDGNLAPGKSVSVMSIFDERIDRAHRESVREVGPQIEALACCKTNRHLERTGNAVYAAYHHQVSRTLDPQIHTHFAVVNLTHDEENQQWKALAAYEMYKARFPIHERYREVLAERVSRLGYGIQERTDRNGGWEIAGVSPAIMQRYSQRASQRDEKIEEYITRTGEMPNHRQVAMMVREDRLEKKVLPQEEIRERQLARLTPSERESLVELRERAIERYVPVEYETWHPNPYNREPEPKERDEPEPKKQKPHSWNLDDHVEHEAPAEYHRPWSYGEKKQRAY